MMKTKSDACREAPRPRRGAALAALTALAAGALFVWGGLGSLAAQAFDPFGEDDSSPGFSLGGDAGGGGGGGGGVTIGGSLTAEALSYTESLSSLDDFTASSLGDMVSGELKFSASGSRAEAFINLDLSPAFDEGSSPLAVDEAYLRAYLGPVSLEAGIRKLTWGKADSLGPLDVVNPLDYRDLTSLDDLMALKIGRPLVHASWGIGSKATLEGVFVPWFEGYRFAASGRWAPAQMSGMMDSVGAFLPMLGLLGFDEKQIAQVQTDIESFIAGGGFTPDASSLEYAQGGLRFTRNMGAWDIGAQYYFGRLPRPAFLITMDDQTASEAIDLKNHTLDISKLVKVDYNWFHQIGLDYAQVIAGFNTRAEAAIHLTRDTDGTKADVYNPFAAWSLGFDRTLFWNITANLQANETVRLFNDETGDDPMKDVEGGKDMTATRITAYLSRTFLRDALEVKVTALWGIEDQDFLVIPALTWTKDDLSVSLCAGFFGGDDEGELGQYGDNSYLKAAVTCRF